MRTVKNDLYTTCHIEELNNRTDILVTDKPIFRVGVRNNADGHFDFEEAAKVLIWCLGKEKLSEFLLNVGVTPTEEHCFMELTPDETTGEYYQLYGPSADKAENACDSFYSHFAISYWNWQGRHVSVSGRKDIQNLYFYLLASDLDAIDISDVASHLDSAFAEFGMTGGER